MIRSSMRSCSMIITRVSLSTLGIGGISTGIFGKKIFCFCNLKKIFHTPTSPNIPKSRLLLNESLRLTLPNTSKPNSGSKEENSYFEKIIKKPSVVMIGGGVVILELRNDSRASFVSILLSNLSSSISQIDGQTLKI